MANQQIRILVVDDEVRLAHSTADLLRSAGYMVNTLNDAAAAVAHLSQANYDLALLDINMPGMSGFQLLDSLERGAISTAFIMMTGDAHLDNAVEALRRGAADYIRKPFDPGELLIRVSNVLTAKALRASNQKITAENHELELKLQQSQKMEAIGTLAGGIAHDFNNILSIVIGNTELARAQLSQPTIVADNLEKVLSATTRAKELIDQLLHFSRKDGEGWKSLELSSLIGDCLKLIRATIPSNIQIMQDTPDSSLYIRGDATQLHQVVINLCANAAHAMENDGGTLQVSLQSTVVDNNNQRSVVPAGEYVVLSVKDDGHGVAPDIRHQIFDPYFTTKTRGRGTGMGLAVVHGIVANHGGHIECISEIGNGTEFRIMMPVTDLRNAMSGGEKKDEPSPGSERILLVDDEEMIVDVVANMLRRLGYQVDPHTNSVAALEIFESTPDRFDLLVTDLTMPNMGGDELASQVRKIRPDLPILVCSGLNTDDNTALLKESDSLAFIGKPFALSDLSQAIRRLLNRNPSERRQKPRFAPQSAAFVVFRSRPDVKCRVVDVSLTGLAVTCEQAPSAHDALTILSANDDCILDNVQCDEVSKVSFGDAESAFRLGVNFLPLSTEQARVLETYLSATAAPIH